MRSTLFSVLAIVVGLASTSAFADSQISVSLNSKSNSNGLRFALKAQFPLDIYGNCSVTNFQIGTYDKSTGKFTRYVSHAGNVDWDVNSKKCNVNTELNQDLLQSGKTIEVMAYSRITGYSEVHFQKVPCKDQLVLNEDYFFGLSASVDTVCTDKHNGNVVIEDDAAQ